MGHLDTGMDSKHPTLCDRIATFAQFDHWGDRVLDAQPWDSGNHGTHTAGLAIGVAPDAQLCSGMVIEGGHPLVRVLAGLDWLFDQHVQVLCLSLGVPGYNPLFEIVLARLRQQGVLPVCPIGNQGRRISCSPANYPNVLAVGAIDAQDQIPGFSGSGASIVAPGVNLLSAQPDGSFASQTGTSMAAAIVAGVAALLFQAKPTATVEEVEMALLNGCTPLSDLPTHRVGNGLVNPIEAVKQLLERNDCDPSELGESNRTITQFSPPKQRIDSRLQRQLDNANPEDLIAGIAIVVGVVDPLTVPDDAGLGEQVIQRINATAPTQLRFFPRGNAIAFIATPDFFQALSMDSEVCFLSSTTIDLIYFG